MLTLRLSSPISARLARWMTCLLLTAWLAACGGGGDQPKGFNAVVEAAPNTGTTSLTTTSINLNSLGYQASEYFFAGTARSYTSSSPLLADGKWSVTVADQADYKTRMVVYRPNSAANFNGTVIVEWLNVTRADAAVDWIMAHNELIRSGYAWVGVSAQKVGVDALKATTSSRYATLSHPGDSFSYDVFSQAAKAVLQPQGINPLAGLSVKKMIAAGESQSAQRLMTYANAFGSTASINGLFDGFFVHSRTYAGAALSQSPQVAVATPGGLKLRDDLTVPAMMLQTEYDVYKFSSAAARQDDTAKLRLWEVAGTSHVDFYTVAGTTDYGIDSSFASVLENRTPLNCAVPVNSGPQRFVVSAALAALRTWIVDGTAPSFAPRIEVSEAPLNVRRDTYGNALGGIRTPYVDVPVATLSADGQPAGSLCTLFGSTKLFDAATLRQLYSSHDDYVTKVGTSVAAAQSKGFLLPADATLINLSAQKSSVGVP